MLKEYKLPNELLEIMKSRNIVMDIDEKVVAAYLEQYSYNMIVNPYKIMYCSGIDNEWNHEYDKSVNVSAIISFFDLEKNFMNILFKYISEFEMNFSSYLTMYYMKEYHAIKKQINSEIITCINEVNKQLLFRLKRKYDEILNGISSDEVKYKKVDEFVHKIKLEYQKIACEIKDDLFVNIKNCRKAYTKIKNVISIKDISRGTKLTYEKINAILCDNIVSESESMNIVKSFFSEKDNALKYSYFHGGKNKLSFNDKIILFKLLPQQTQLQLMKKMRALKQNDTPKYKISREIDSFVDDLRIIKTMRNQCYHINSLAYFQYKDTRNELYKRQWTTIKNGKNIIEPKNSMKYKNTKIKRLLTILKLIENENDNQEVIVQYDENMKEIFENTVSLYDLYSQNQSLQRQVAINKIQSNLTKYGFNDII